MDNEKKLEYITFQDLELMFKNIDLKKFWEKVEAGIRPSIEAYRIARARSYAAAQYHVFI